MPTVRRKLAIGLMALVLAVMSIVGILTERGLRSRSLERIDRSLVERAHLVRELVGSIPLEPNNSAELDALADRAGEIADARVTLIGRDGEVVADSDVPLAALPRVEDHSGRPEVIAAMRGEIGRSSRLSETVGREMLYLAVPAEGGAASGVIRLAVDLREIEAAARDNRNAILVAASAGLLAALILSLFLARVTIRPIEELHDVVSAIADGDLDQRARLLARNDLGEFGMAVNRVAEQLRSRLDDATREKERLEAVLASMVEGVLVLDEEGRVSLANPRLSELLNLWGPLEGRLWFEVIRNADAAKALQDAITGTALISREVSGAGGGERILQLNAVGFPSQGPRAGTILVLHDMTEIRRLDNVRRDFIANASHELRTPLTAVKGFAEILVANPELSREERKKYLETIQRNAQRMFDLVEDLLVLSRVESGSEKLEIGCVDLPKAIRALLTDLTPRLEAASIEASLQTAAEGCVRADQRAVEQILTNLLDNAIKYTPEGGKIVLSIEDRDASVRIDISDTGLGIPLEDQDRIFERFYRVDAARSRALGGTGLGLAIVKHLVQSMNGEVWVESEIGRGTRFTVSLPRFRKT